MCALKERIAEWFFTKTSWSALCMHCSWRLFLLRSTFELFQLSQTVDFPCLRKRQRNIQRKGREKGRLAWLAFCQLHCGSRGIGDFSQLYSFELLPQLILIVRAKMFMPNDIAGEIPRKDSIITHFTFGLDSSFFFGKKKSIRSIYRIILILYSTVICYCTISLLLFPF